MSAMVTYETTVLAESGAKEALVGSRKATPPVVGAALETVSGQCLGALVGARRSNPK